MLSYNPITRQQLAQLITDFAIVRQVPGLKERSYNVDLNMYGQCFTLSLTYCNNDFYFSPDLKRISIGIKSESDKDFNHIVSCNLNKTSGSALCIGLQTTNIPKVVYNSLLEVATETLFNLRHNMV